MHFPAVSKSTISLCARRATAPADAENADVPSPRSRDDDADLGGANFESTTMSHEAIRIQAEGFFSGLVARGGTGRGGRFCGRFRRDGSPGAPRWAAS